MKTIKLTYAALYNAGDLMNIELVEQLSGCRVQRSKTYCAEMTAIGGALFGLQYSTTPLKRLAHRVLRLYWGKKPVAIWGSGFWHTRNPNGLYRDNLQVCALRGEKSRQHLQKLTGRYYDVPLADAGLLVGRLFTPAAEKCYRIGLIPHMSQVEEPAMQRMAQQPGVHLIDIRNTPGQVGYEISRCETVVSSSLHGLIFADALHVPNLHVLGEKELPEGNFKFEDYYSAYGLIDAPQLLSAHFPTAEEVLAAYRVDGDAVEEKKRQLLACFPYEAAGD